MEYTVITTTQIWWQIASRWHSNVAWKTLSVWFCKQPVPWSSVDQWTYAIFTGRLRVLVVHPRFELVFGGTVHVVLDRLEVDDEVEDCPQLSEYLLRTMSTDLWRKSEYRVERHKYFNVMRFAKHETVLRCTAVAFILFATLVMPGWSGSLYNVTRLVNR